MAVRNLPAQQNVPQALRRVWPERGGLAQGAEPLFPEGAFRFVSPTAVQRLTGSEARRTEVAVAGDWQPVGLSTGLEARRTYDVAIADWTAFCRQYARDRAQPTAQ